MNRYGYLQTILSPTPSTSSTMMTPENAEEDPDDPEPADEGDIQIEYSPEWLYSQSTEQ